MDCIIGGIIGGVVGARAYYVLLNWNNYAGDWKSILNIREGGLAIYGGIIGSFLAGLLVAKDTQGEVPAPAGYCRHRIPAGTGHRTLGQLLQPGKRLAIIRIRFLRWRFRPTIMLAKEP